MPIRVFPKRLASRLARRKDSAGYYYLWAEFLKLSPSYLLAHRVRCGELAFDPEQREGFPGDFERVLEVYDYLGSVSDCTTDEWLKRVRSKVDGMRRLRPKLHRLGVIHRTSKTPLHDLGENIKHYLKGEWRNEGRPHLTVISIPKGLPKASAVRQFSALLDELGGSTEPTGELRGLPLASPRIQMRTLVKYMGLLWFRAARPKAYLWQIGAHVRISATHGWDLNVNSKASQFNRDERNVLSVIASRALRDARMVAENAARGRFPSRLPCPHALAFDWDRLRRRLKRQREFQKARDRQSIMAKEKSH